MNKDATTVLDLIQIAGNRAMAVDGPVPPDHEMLDKKDLIRFFRAAYALAKQTKTTNE